MDRAEREQLRTLIDAAARERAERNYMNLDPERISLDAARAEAQGHHDVARSLRQFRDFINELLGMGWELGRIEEAFEKHWRSRA